jgi:hypothetical protein
MNEKKPRRKLTVADHLARYDERIARLALELDKAKSDRIAYIGAIHDKAIALTAELPEE